MVQQINVWFHKQYHGSSSSQSYNITKDVSELLQVDTTDLDPEEVMAEGGFCRRAIQIFSQSNFFLIYKLFRITKDYPVYEEITRRSFHIMKITNGSFDPKIIIYYSAHPSECGSSEAVVCEALVA